MLKQMERKVTQGRPKKTISVVIADDSAVVREMLMRLCAQLPGLRVLGEAEDGEKTLEAIRKYRPDLLILDLRMPKLNGIEALNIITEKKLGCEVVVFTGMADAWHREKCLELGARAVFEKGTEFNRLLEMLTTLETL